MKSRIYGVSFRIVLKVELIVYGITVDRYLILVYSEDRLSWGWNLVYSTNNETIMKSKHFMFKLKITIVDIFDKTDCGIMDQMDQFDNIKPICNEITIVKVR